MSYIIHRPAFRTADPFTRFFDTVFSHPGGGQPPRNGVSSTSSPTQSWRPRADISETDTSYIVRADIPDTPRDNVSITLEENILTLSGSRKTSEKHSEERAIRTERFAGEFQRRFTLPEDADEEGITASFDSGVLTITIPRKAPVEAPGKRTIAIA